MYRYVLIADYPAPWREKVYEIVHRSLGDEFHVVYCTRKEERRLWKFPLGNHPKTFLKVITLGAKDNERFFSPGIVPFLLKHRPEVLIGFSLHPTVLAGFVTGRLLRSKSIVFSDTWLGRDRSISRLQKLARRFVYHRFADAFIGASEQTLRLFKHYRPDVPNDSMFISSLCADNDYFRQCLEGREDDRKYDIVFSGRIAAEKNPLFFAEVACRLRTRLGSCRALILGDGDGNLKQAMLRKLADGGVDYDFPGFVEHARLPYYYSKGKVLLMPTSGDCWGVVLNEAMVCGLPVVTTEWTAAVGELVRDAHNGYVLPLDSAFWADRIASLLTDGTRWQKFSENAMESVRNFTFEAAAGGILEAITLLENHQ
ncbi:MAG: glycosyltransferase family 4 protein [Syntrophobacteraceae bacterium]|jgi:glycosyltransferase involved in cell wall biosynthesis